MIPPLLILPYLCALSAVLEQSPAPKPAGLLPEAQQWIRDHAADAEAPGPLAERLRTAKSIVLVDATTDGAGAHLVTRCQAELLARDEPPLFGLASSWEEVRTLDTWLADGKGTPGALLEKPALEAARAWNSDEKHTRKLRAAGLEYRTTRDAAMELVDFITRIDPQLDQRAGVLLGPFRQLGPDGRHRYDKTDENWRFSVRQVLSDLHEQSGERREAWEGIVGAAGYLAAMRNLRQLMQAEQEVSQPAEFRRGRALCLNAAAAREELAPGATLLAYLRTGTALERQDAHEVLGAGTLVVLVLGPGEDLDYAALAGQRPSGLLDLRDLPKEGLVANWFAAHLGKRADVVIWSGAR